MFVAPGGDQWSEKIGWMNLELQFLKMLDYNSRLLNTCDNLQFFKIWTD